MWSSRMSPRTWVPAASLGYVLEWSNLASRGRADWIGNKATVGHRVAWSGSAAAPLAACCSGRRRGFDENGGGRRAQEPVPGLYWSRRRHSPAKDLNDARRPE